MFLDEIQSPKSDPMYEKYEVKWGGGGVRRGDGGKVRGPSAFLSYHVHVIACNMLRQIMLAILCTLSVLYKIAAILGF